MKLRLSRHMRLAIGLAVVAVAMGGVWWIVDTTNQLRPYLVTTTPLLSGETFESAGVDVVYLTSPAGNLGLIAPERSDEFRGQVAAMEIPAGTVLLASHFGAEQSRDVTAFSVRIDIGGARWLAPGRYVDVWVSAPMDNQQFSVPEVASSMARIVEARGEEGFAANPDLVRVDLEVSRRDLAALVHARANSFDIQLSPSVPVD